MPISKHTLLAFLVIMLVIVTGMYIMRTPVVPVQTDNGTSLTNETTTPAFVSFTTNIPTDDWNEYRNVEYGFSFKYPRDYAIDVATGTSNFEKRFVAIDVGPADYIADLKTGVGNETEGLPLYVRVVANEPVGSESLKCGEDWGESERQATIDEQEWLVCMGKMLGDFPWLRIDTTRDNIMFYSMESWRYRGSDKEKIDAIISTFKFLE